MLHPAEIFLDMSGEEIRRRLFLTSGASGEELCLRPEYTIPVCRAYLASNKVGRTAEYSYLGPVFVRRSRAANAPRPASRASAERTRKPQTPRSSRWRWKPRLKWALRLPRASATRDCSTACSRRSRCRASGPGVYAVASRKAGTWPPSSTGAARAQPRRRGCLPRWKPPTTPAPRRWWRIC